MVVHIASREPHGLDGFVKRNRMDAVAGESELGGGDSFDRTERVTLDAGHCGEKIE
jgi:hypothetical protein